jgi:hypothetical protein
LQAAASGALLLIGYKTCLGDYQTAVIQRYIREELLHVSWTAISNFDLYVFGICFFQYYRSSCIY